MHTLPPVDPTSAEPIYRQLYWRFRSAIAEGLLKPGERVPMPRRYRQATLRIEIERCGSLEHRPP